RVLDYGCGYSPYLRDLSARGVRIAGADISERVVEEWRACGYEVTLIENLERIPYPDNEFEYVYLMQVIEHIWAPHAFFSELHRTLKFRGEVCLAMPNSDSIYRYVFGEHWVSGWFAPFHLFHYNLQSLTKLASIHGFKVINFWTSTPESWFR